jgi:tight adherence protein B
MDILTGIGIFLVVLLLIEGSYALFRVINDPGRRRVKRRLQHLSMDSSGSEPENPGLVRLALLSQVPWLNRWLHKFRWTPQMKSLLAQSGTRRPLGFFVLLSLVLAGAGFVIGSRIVSSLLILLPLMAGLAYLPFLYLRIKKNRRMQKFEAQLPEAMELMARALKAGHAFSGALKMVIEEMDEPIAEEFNKTIGEINFGVDVPEALKNLSLRVDCPDLRFFVISVIIQRETGGNLAEILENIAYLIRERFKLHGRIRVLSAEGKFSAVVLIGLPFLVASVIAIINPEYIGTLITDPVGNILVVAAIFMMFLGVVVMKRMIQIKV